MEPLNLYLFGAPRLALKNQPIPVGRRKTLALLAYLALTNQPQSRHTLHVLLWPDSDRASGKNNLRRELTSLRKLLGKELIIADRHEIALQMGPNLAMDVAQFRTPLTIAHQHESTLCATCLEVHETAVSAYTAEFMMGFSLADAPEYNDWLFFERQKLQNELATLLLNLIRHYESNREAETAIQYAHHWLKLDPLNEAAHRLLIRLFASNNQRNAALQQYERCVEILAQELDIEPEEQTKALWESIRQGDGYTPWLQETDSPLPSSTETVPQAETDESIPNNLPLEATPFIGRQREQADLRDLLLMEETRLVTITGAGGMGKTRLALAMAKMLTTPQTDHPFPEGIFFVELAALQTAALIPTTIGQAIGIRIDQSEQQLYDYLANKQMLLIIDNFEHLLEGAAVLQELLQKTKRVTILATSRERLRLRHEQLFPISGLATPTTAQPQSTASELFLRSAQRVDPAFTPSHNDWPAIVQLCQLVAGMPLALELAASWIDMLTPTEIAEEIARNLDFLASELIDIPERHRSVRAAIDTSWQYLTTEQKQQFAQLSIFHGGFSREAAAQIAGVSLRSLSHFVNKSFLGFQRQSKRYTIHEMLRQFAAEKLSRDASVAQSSVAKHAEFYSGLLGAWNWFTQPTVMAATLDLIGQDIDNIRAAWAFLVETQQVAALERGFVSLLRYHQMRGSLAEGGDILIDLLRQIPADHPAFRGWVNLTQANFLRWQGDYDESQRHAAKAEAIGAEIGSAEMIATALLESGTTFWMQGQFEQSIQNLEKGLPLAQQTQRREVEATIILRLGTNRWKQGNFELARSHYDQALSIYREHDFWVWQGRALNLLGILLRHQNQLDEGVLYLREGVEISKKAGDSLGLSRTLSNLGRLEWQLGNLSLGFARIKESLSLQQKIGHQRGVAASNVSLSLFYLELGQLEEAQPHIEQALEIYVAIGADHDLIQALVVKSRWAFLSQDYELAYELAQHGLQIGYQGDILLGRDSLMCCCGRALLALARLDMAADAYHDALRFREERDLLGLTVVPLAGLARLALKKGKMKEALSFCEQILERSAQERALSIFNPFDIDLACYEVLTAVSDPRATTFLQAAVERLQTKAQRIADYALRRLYLDNMPTHRALLTAAPP